MPCTMPGKEQAFNNAIIIFINPVLPICPFPNSPEVYFVTTQQYPGLM